MKTFKEFVTLNFKKNQLKKQVNDLTDILVRLTSIPKKTHLLAAMRAESVKLKAHDNTTDYWLDEKSTFKEWLKSHGVKFYGNSIPEYADGGVGRCYFLGNYVVKMSANRVEANVAKMVSGREDLPTNIIDVLPLQNGIYAILQHYVNVDSVPKNILKASDYMSVLIDNLPEESVLPTDKSLQEELCIKTLRGKIELLPSMMLFMELLIKLYNATGFTHDDAGPTNIGLHKGRIVIPDLGPNETGKFDSKKALDKIKKNREILGLPNHDFI